MARLAITLILLGSCSGAARPGSATGSSEPSVVMAKKIALSWGIESHGETSDIFLATTDETGKQVSHPLGRYKGTCAVITPTRAMNALTGVACRTGATGTELHAVVEHGEDIVILQLGINDGVVADPMARDEIARVKVPRGASIEVGG